MSTKYITCVTKQSKKSLIANIALHVNLVFKENTIDVGLPPKPDIFLHDLIL